MSSPRVVVIGAGFGGLGVAQRAARAGVDDITILERADDVGGVWRDNTYPGAACDVPSSLYSWSWAPNPELGAPLRRPARHPRLHPRRRRGEAGLLDLVRTGVEVNGARSTTTRGAAGGSPPATARRSRPTWWSRAVGQLSNPVVPRHPRRRHVRRAGLPLRAVAPRRRPDRQAGRGRRHRRQRHPVRARHRRPGRAR